MAIERHPITSREQWLELRKKDVTASVVGALWGYHPFTTAASVWAEKMGFMGPTLNTGPMERGIRLEPVVAAWVQEKRPEWKIEKAAVYLRDPYLRIGGTPDYFYVDGEGRRGVLQIKTASPSQFEEHWTQDAAPLWIMLQTLTEAYLEGAQVATIAVLVSDAWTFELYLYDVPRHAAAEARIITAVEKFWRETEKGNQPDLDYDRDGALLNALYPRHVPAKLVDLPPGAVEVLERYERMDEAIKTATAALEADKNRLKEWLTDAEAGHAIDKDGNEWVVTLRTQEREAYSVKETTFRRLRVKRITPDGV
jgi:predicted phage-related endonuclease